MPKYDYIIIGAGPAGLTLAYYLNLLSKTCLLIDANNSIGGCHRVERVNGLFCEHSPRVYSNSYLNTINLLKSMNIQFTDLFTSYFSFTELFTTSIQNFTIYEISILFTEFIKLLAGLESSRTTSVLDFMESNQFSYKAIDFADRLCRMTDGAGSDRYPLFEFLQLMNQQSLYQLYDIKLPNDIGLFKLWKENMPNVQFLLNTRVNQINIQNNKILDIDGYQANNYILAIPPKPLYELLKKSNIENTFSNNFQEWTIQNSYIDDICIVFHWDTKLNLDDVWGFPRSDWNVVFKVMTKYTDFQDSNSLTVISAGITHTTKKSKYNNKTANECDTHELINETLRQLQESFETKLPKPSHSIISPNVYKKNGKWVSSDDAYVMSANKNTFIQSESLHYTNLFNLGTQNGASKYYFTSMESAVTNAIALLHKLEPISKNSVEIQNPYTITSIVRWFILFLIIIIIVIRK